MENSNLDKNVEKKVTDVVGEKIKDGTINLDDMVDVSDDQSINLSTTLIESDDAKKVEVNDRSFNEGVSSDMDGSHVVSNESTSSDEIGNDGIFNEVSNIFKDGKSQKLDKHEDLKSSDLKDTIDTAKNNLKPIADEAKKNIKPVVDDVKKTANQLKEQGKKAAAKAGGAAISAATDGIVPPKLGEWASKKALDKIEKKGKKAFSNAKNSLKNNLSQRKENIKEKVQNNEKLQKLKKKGANTLRKIGKTIKAIKTIKFIEKYGPIIAVAVAIFVAIASVASVVSVIQTYVPGIFGDVKDETDTDTYSKRDIKILSNIKEVVDKYPNVSTDEAANILATVAYPYHTLLQNDNVKALSGENDEDEDDDELDEMELLFESDSNLTASEKYEKYKMIFGSITEAATMTFKEWLADQFGYELSDDDDEDDGNPSNDMYLTIFKKDKYIDKFDELMEIYSNDNTEDKSIYKQYLEDTYYKNDDGYKDLIENTEDEEELILEIEKDVEDNTELYEVYIPQSCATSYSSQSGGQITIDYTNSDGISLQDLLTKNILVDVKKEGCTETGKLTNCASLYSSPITMEKYIIGVTLQEVGNDLNNIEHIKANMVAEKSFAINRAYERGNVVPLSEDTYVIGIIDSTRDQDYCDYETGESCSSGNANPSQAAIENLKQAWEESKDTYLWNGSQLLGSVCQNQSYASACFCSAGSCLFQEEVKDGYSSSSYTDILSDQFSAVNATFLNIEGNYISSSTVISSTTCSSGTGNSLGIPDDQFIFYYQNDYNDLFCGSDATIAKAGCGGTSYAMLVANLSNDTSFNPVDASNEGEGSGNCGSGGSSNGLFLDTLVNKHSGFTAEVIPTTSDGAQQVLDVIKNGGLVVANVQANSPFTGGGHWIIIRGITEDGKVKVADPASSDRSLNGTYAINDFIDLDYFIDTDDGKTMHSWIAVYGPKSEEIKESNQAASTGDGITTGTFIYPIKSITSHSCNDYPKYSSGAAHTGTDMSVSIGTEVLAVDGGTVVVSKDLVGCDGRNCVGGYYSYGRYIEIEHSNGLKTLYAHLSERKVSVGDKVSQGQVIGLSGENGNTTGPHLHFEVKSNGNTVNPCNYFK